MLTQIQAEADPEGHFDLPAWIVTAIGLSLGSLGIVHLLYHPEPLTIWALEGLIVAVPAVTLTYGGHWTARRSSGRGERWIVAVWTLCGALITSGSAVGYVLSERLASSTVPEVEQLAVFGALSGSFVAFLVVASVYHYGRRRRAMTDGGSVVTLYNLRVILGLLGRRRFGGVAGLLTQVALGRNLWMEYLRRFRATDGLVPFATHGVTLFLDPMDEGISRDLLTYGRREERATDVLRHETASLRSAVDGSITALDIGANRGYYSFQLADLLDDTDTVYAIEPEPNNVASLRRGTEANRFENVRIEQGAIGDEDGTQELLVSARSNSHTLNADRPASKEDGYHSSIEVPVWTVDSFLRRHGLAPDDVNVVKLDVEGFEPAVIESLEPVFRAGGPDLLFVELHPHRVATDTLHDIVDRIRTNGFEIVSASSGVADGLPTYRAIREHLDTDDSSHTVELIVRK